MKNNNSIQSILDEKSVRCLTREAQAQSSGGYALGCCQYPPPGYSFSVYFGFGLYIYYN